MISIVMDGKCKDCPYADLELTCIGGALGMKFWCIRCTHEYACEAMKARCNQQEVTANDS